MKQFTGVPDIRSRFILKTMLVFLILSAFSAHPTVADEGNSYEWIQVSENAAWVNRIMHTAVVYDDKLWVMGGIERDELDFINIYVLSDVWWTDTGTEWQQASGTFPGRGAHTSVVHGGGIWTLGGSTYGLYNSCNDVWSSDSVGAWTQITAAADWSSRALHSSVVFNDRVWVLGGVQASLSGENLFYMYDDVWWSSDGATWEQCEVTTPSWECRCSHSSVVYDGRIWIMGGVMFENEGYYMNQESKNDVWSSEDGINWTQVTACAPWAPRYGHTSVVYDGKMWVIGGGEVDYFNDAWFSTDGEQWTEATVMGDWHGSAGHASAVYDNKIWILGGEYENAGLNEVWCLSKRDGVEGEPEGEGEPGPIPHPGDLNADFFMSIDEVFFYLVGWQQGTYPMNYAIRAVYLWQRGEQYVYDTEQAPPMCWILAQ